MPQGTTETAKRLVEHLIGTLLHIWRLVARVAVIAGVSAGLLTEILAGITTHQFPSGPTHLVAAALGIAAAYGAAATVLVNEIFLGLLHTLRVLEGDATAGATAAAALAAREARTAQGELGQRFGRGSASQAPPATARPQPRPQPAHPSVIPATPARTNAAQANTPRATIATPTPRTDPMRVEAYAAELPAQLPPLPVRADRLPRIEWANADAPTIPPSQPTDPADHVAPSAGGPSASAAPSQPEESGPTLTELGFTGVALAAGGLALREHAHATPSAPTITASPAAPTSAEAAPSKTDERSASAASPAETATSVAAHRSPTSSPIAEDEAKVSGPAESATSSPLSPAQWGEAGRGAASPAETATSVASHHQPSSSLQRSGERSGEGSPASPAESAESADATAAPPLANLDYPTVVPTLTTPAAMPTHAPHDAPSEDLSETGEDTPLVPPPAMALSQPLAPDSQPLAEPPAFAMPAAERDTMHSANEHTAPAASVGDTMPPSLPLPDATLPTDPTPPTRPRLSGGVTRPLTRPLAPITGPLAPTSDPLTSPSGSGNLWDRLSQALMGIPPIDPSGEHASESTTPVPPLGAPPLEAPPSEG